MKAKMHLARKTEEKKRGKNRGLERFFLLYTLLDQSFNPWPQGNSSWQGNEREREREKKRKRSSGAQNQVLVVVAAAAA